MRDQFIELKTSLCLPITDRFMIDLFLKHINKCMTNSEN